MHIEPYQPNSEEMEAGFAIPAIVVNRYMTTIHANGMRIAFGEGAFPDSPINYRTAVFLTHEEAEDLKNIIDKLLKTHAEEIAAMRGGKHGEAVNS
jgi:hypothetical protein